MDGKLKGEGIAGSTDGVDTGGDVAVYPGKDGNGVLIISTAVLTECSLLVFKEVEDPKETEDEAVAISVGERVSKWPRVDRVLSRCNSASFGVGTDRLMGNPFVKFRSDHCSSLYSFRMISLLRFSRRLVVRQRARQHRHSLLR
jgi:hypothetical protein